MAARLICNNQEVRAAVRRGAIILDEITPVYPRGSLHVAVVDPGAGTSRSIVDAEIGDQRYIWPDTGLFSRLASRLGASKIRAITEERWFRQPVAPTFHGRDIMVPAAAQLTLGVGALNGPDDLGPVLAQLVSLDRPGAVKVANRIDGQVTAIDSFGNLITDITREMLAGVPTDETVGVFCDEHETRGIFNAYADQPPMTLIALIGSNDCLELAIVDDSAKIMLGVKVGAPVQVRW